MSAKTHTETSCAAEELTCHCLRTGAGIVWRRAQKRSPARVALASRSIAICRSFGDGFGEPSPSPSPSLWLSGELSARLMLRPIPPPLLHSGDASGDAAGAAAAISPAVGLGESASGEAGGAGDASTSGEVGETGDTCSNVQLRQETVRNEISLWRTDDGGCRVCGEGFVPTTKLTLPAQNSTESQYNDQFPRESLH